MEMLSLSVKLKSGWAEFPSRISSLLMQNMDVKLELFIQSLTVAHIGREIVRVLVELSKLVSILLLSMYLMNFTDGPPIRI